MPVPACRLLLLGLPIHAAPPSDDELDVLRRARPAHRQQPLFGLWRRDPCQRADLRERQLTASQRLREARQRTQRTRHANVLPRGAQLEPDASGEAVRARAKPIAPAAAGVEFADEIEQPRGGGVEMRGELGDLVAEVL